MALRPPLAWLSLLGLALPSCEGDTVARTQIMVVVDSDLSAPEQLDLLVVRADGPADRSAKSEATLGPGQPPLPRSLALVHEGGATGPLEVIVEGRLAGQRVLSRRAVVSFEPGRSLLLPMHLLARCIDVQCGEEQTCTESGCAPTALDELEPYRGEKPGLATQGQLDGGLDARVSDDASLPADAGEDASPDARADTGTDAASEAGMCTPEPEQCNMRDDDCDGRVDNGINLQTSTSHCGRCNNRCFEGQLCCSGSCRRNCQ